VSCFDDSSAAPNIWSALAATISARHREVKEESRAEADSISPEQRTKLRSYTRKMLLDRNLRLKKIGEESAELVTACADGDAARSAEEAADLVYHVGVALEAVGSSLDVVAAVLLERSLTAPLRED
jgi:phosphoribosyl-ATP pyrophosphohydrolase/phosphoribosyl-AMP cyclohydrolase